jgi:cardiolipin synthase
VTLDPLGLARQWADELPGPFARRLADALRAGRPAVVLLRADAALPQSSAAATTALALVDAGDAAFVAGALSARLDIGRTVVDITPVWTGPASQARSERLTIAVVSDLINEAETQLVLASYAAIPSAQVLHSLTAAAARGVAITVIVERTLDNPGFTSHGDPFPGLLARRLCWPASSRPPGAAMHVKVLVVDDRVALVGSANLTGYGLERNLECGLLVRGGSVPPALSRHLLGLPSLVETT